MSLPNLKPAALLVPGTIGVAKKFREVLGYAHTPYSQKNSIGLPCRLFINVHLFSRNFRLEFWVGLRTSNVGEGGHRGSGMAPSEIALVSSYRPSVQIIPLGSICNRLPEILDWNFWVWVANPRSWEEEVVECRG